MSDCVVGDRDGSRELARIAGESSVPKQVHCMGIGFRTELSFQVAEQKDRKYPGTVPRQWDTERAKS